VHRVDVPGLQRSGVQRPSGPQDRPGEREQTDVVGDRHEQERGGAEQSGQHQHGAVTDGVGQPAGGQLEQQGHRAVHRDGEPDVGGGQAA
jgi:hypothetical protein